jgi:hypothetical protein
MDHVKLVEQESRDFVSVLIEFLPFRVFIPESNVCLEDGMTIDVAFT